MAKPLSRILMLACGLVMASVSGAAPAMASETGPVIVIPGRPGVPVIENGRDISYAVVEGDWGLYRPSQTNPVVIYRYGLPPPPYQDAPRARYFPSGGPPPRLGRKEVDIPRPLQQQEGTIRSWGVQSAPTPATSPTPLDVPGMVVVPEDRRWRSP